MCQEEEEEEDLPTLKIASIRQFKDYIKEERKTDYRSQKQHKQHKDQQNDNNEKTKMGRKATVWAFQLTNKWNLIWDNLGMSKKGNP